MSISDLGMLFQFAGGLGMFLYGMATMADGLQRTAGSRMQHMLGVLTNNRLLGVLAGAIVTAIIQSSSATTVMVVGFVNAGLINLLQATGIIMGANIGTTITSWIVSMSEWGEVLKPEFFAPFLFFIGAFLVMFTKSHKKKEGGEILIGFALLFIGLSFMSSSIEPYRDAPVFSQAFQTLGQNPLLGVLVGLVVTAIIQSSSASVGILQTLALNGMVNWQSAVFITLGQNIGTCVTALLSSVGASRTAKRAAVIHLLFNVFGTILFGTIMFIVFLLNPSFAASSADSVGISIFHTIFNVSNTIILFPFAGLLVKTACAIVKEKKSERTEDDVETDILRHLDDRLLESPSFAIDTAEKEVINMGKVAIANLKIATAALTDYLVKINNLSLNDSQHLLVKNLFYTIGDIERIGDHAENLAELAQTVIRTGSPFSESGEEDLKKISGAALQSVETAVESREHKELSKVRQAARYEEAVDSLEEELKELHMERLSNRECSTESGVIFLDAISNYERIADHARNIAGYVKEEIQ